MTDKQSRQRQVAALLAQDHEINDSRLQEFRMQLEQSLAKWERDGRTVRRAGWIGAAVTILSMFAILPLQAIPALRNNGLVFFLYMLGWTASLLVTGYLIILYREKYARGISQARFDLQMALLRELQEQVEQLRRQVNPPE